MLNAYPKVGNFLKEPAVAQLGAAPAAPDATQAESMSCRQDGALDFLQPSSRPDSLGRLGHYEMLQVLGRGGFGIVFRAFDDLLQRVVAVKVMASQMAALSPARKRFLREARSSAAARHENVVQIYEVGEQPLPYLVMEFIPGETLQQKLDRCGPLDVLEVLRIGRQIAEGLAAAHACELVYRDTKPGNILLEGGSHKVRITDFGLARTADDASITQSGFVAGTPMFMSPEQALGHTIDQRADLFSLGSVLYQMVSGRPPFRAPSTLAVLKRVAEEPPRPIPEIIPETPDWLCGIITKLHAKNPAERFQSARQVADLLADCEAKLKAKQEVKNVLPGAARPAGRKWVAAAAVLLVPVIVLAVTELAGVTHLLPRQATENPIKPDAASAPVVVGKNEEPADAKVAKAGGKEPDAKVVSEEKKSPPPAPEPPVEVAQPTPTVHDTWVKAAALLPLDQHAAALPTKLKERVPAFDEAFFRAIPTTAAGRQKIMAEAWLKERKPAFAGFEDAWLKVIPSMSGDAQAVLVAAWLRERNPAFDGDVTPKIKGGVVTSLEVPSSVVQDLTPLRTLTGLRAFVGRSTLGYDNQAARDAAVLRSLKKLENINGKSVAQFWKDVEAKQVEFEAWLKLVPTLDAKQQVAAVVAKLKERNPGFDGNRAQPLLDRQARMIFKDEIVTDLSPVRALVGLKYLMCDKAPLSDLVPLKGMPLTSLSLYGCTQIRDLSPLEGMPLTTLNLGKTQILDLSPLKGMPLANLNIFETEVQNLEALKGMPLTILNVGRTQVRDLETLKGMPLKTLWIQSSGVTDLKPLQGMELEEIRRTPKNITQGLDILRAMKSLKTIGISALNTRVWPAAEFWERHDKGEFKQ